MLITNKNNFVFLIVFFIKLIFIISLVPSIQEIWFVDFIKNSIYEPSLDPWSNYLMQSGDPLGFPYGPIMFLTFIPISFFLNFWVIHLEWKITLLELDLD